MDAEPEIGAAGGATLRRRLAALALGLVLALVGAEVAYRLIRVDALSPTTNPAYVDYDAELGWSYRPGSVARHRSAEFDVEVRINAQGFRGADWPAKRAGRKRVLILGDSLAFGWGVSQQETFAAQLARLEPSWDVLNAAVSGYGTDQELLLLHELKDEVAPDLVVCLFCTNDLFECSGAVAYGRHKPYFAVTERGLELRGTPVPRPWLERLSQLGRAFAKWRWNREHDGRVPNPERDWGLVTKLFLAMRKDLGDVPLLVLSERQQLERLAERGQLLHVDLRPPLQELGASARFPIDGHFSAEGHAAIAELLRERARELLR